MHFPWEIKYAVNMSSQSVDHILRPNSSFRSKGAVKEKPYVSTLRTIDKTMNLLSRSIYDLKFIA